MAFNGWYADTEIMRNLLDADRYNKSDEIVRACMSD
jgi:nitric oxide synthase oxygenase domain/subunit